MGERDNFLRDMEAMLDRKNQILEKKINNNTDTQMAALHNQIVEITKDNETTKSTVKVHEERLVNIEKKNNTQDSIERNSNIIIYGVQENNYGEVLRKIIEILKELVPETTKYHIKGLIKLSKGGWNTNGPIKVNLISNILKNDIMRSKHKLQGRELRIAEDLSIENREIRKKLAPYSLAEKNKGNKVFMRKDTLVINGRTWTLNELQNKDTDVMETATQEQETILQQNQGNTENKGLKRSHSSIVSPANTVNTIKKNKTTTKQDNSNQRNLNEMWASPQNNKEGSPSNELQPINSSTGETK